jgi:hypothetical protein
MKLKNLEHFMDSEAIADQDSRPAISSILTFKVEHAFESF